MTGSGCQVLITKEHGYLIVDGRYITEAKEKELKGFFAEKGYVMF